MANFGFHQLTVVAPYEPHWREARSAVDAEQILEQAQVVDTLAEAIQDATLVFGTGSMEARKPDQPVLNLAQIGPRIQQELAQAGRIAVVFGPEKHGLTRDDLAWCHAMIEIPTSTLQPSMNLGQAVAVCLYEFSARGSLHPDTPTDRHQLTPYQQNENYDPAARSADLDRLANLIEQTMLASNYSPKTMQTANQHDLRVTIRRLQFTQRDLRRALGLFRRVLHTLNR